MADNLDIGQPLVEPDPDTGELKATPYFEEYLFQIVQLQGGEGSTLPDNIDQLANLGSGWVSLLPRVTEVEKTTIDNTQNIALILSEIGNLRALIGKQEQRIMDMEQLNVN